MKIASFYNFEFFAELVLVTCIFLSSVLVTICLSNQMASCIIHPLRKLNSRLGNVRASNGAIVELRPEQQSSQEVSDLYETFKLLI